MSPLGFHGSVYSPVAAAVAAGAAAAVAAAVPTAGVVAISPGTRLRNSLPPSSNCRPDTAAGPSTLAGNPTDCTAVAPLHVFPSCGSRTPAAEAYIAPVVTAAAVTSIGGTWQCPTDPESLPSRHGALAANLPLLPRSGACTGFCLIYCRSCCARLATVAAGCCVDGQQCVCVWGVSSVGDDGPPD